MENLEVELAQKWLDCTWRMLNDAQERGVAEEIMDRQSDCESAASELDQTIRKLIVSAQK